MRNRFKRIAALTLTLVVVFPLAIVAANWQWNRHHEREFLNTQITKSIENSPISINTAVLPNNLAKQEYRKVSIAGQNGQEITWWRKQSLDGIPGYIALTTFEFMDGTQIVLALGWSAQPIENLAADFSQAVARIRFIRNFEKDPGDLPINQTNTPASILRQDEKIYLELVTPKFERLTALPLPQMTAGPHLGYVGQWILIAIFAIAVYIIAIRNLPEN